MRDERHGVRVRGSGESSSEDIFVSSFLWKIEISLIHHRNLRYDYGQEIRPGPTRTRLTINT